MLFDGCVCSIKHVYISVHAIHCICYSLLFPPLQVLNKGLAVKEFELKDRNFSETGNFGFGIDEHIDLGLRYDPSVGIFGMDFFIVLARPGFRVSKKKHKRGRVGVNHRITKSDAQEWFKSKFGGSIRSDLE